MRSRRAAGYREDSGDSKMVTPRMVRVRLAGRDLARFASERAIVRLLFPLREWRRRNGRRPGKNGPTGVCPRMASGSVARLHDPRCRRGGRYEDIDFVARCAWRRREVGGRCADRRRHGCPWPDGLGLRQPNVLLVGDETAGPATGGSSPKSIRRRTPPSSSRSRTRRSARPSRIPTT